MDHNIAMGLTESDAFDVLTLQTGATNILINNAGAIPLCTPREISGDVRQRDWHRK